MGETPHPSSPRPPPRSHSRFHPRSRLRVPFRDGVRSTSLLNQLAPREAPCESYRHRGSCTNTENKTDDIVHIIPILFIHFALKMHVHRL